jgi:hypothetical protein
MSDLHLKPAATGALMGDKAVAVPALDAGASAATSSRSSAEARTQRRRLNATRLVFEDSGFRLFRVY